MKDKVNSAADILRQKAEELVTDKSLGSDVPFSESEMLKLIHELQVHQVELEMQNEELIFIKDESDTARKKFKVLYDFAPTGYFTLTSLGEIIRLNLCASQMLGKERSALKNNRMGFFISDDTKAIFNLFLEKVFESKTKEHCEVTFTGNVPLVVQFNGIISESGKNCLLAAVDITERKAAEIALGESRQLYADLVANQSAGIYRIRVQKQEPGKSVFELSSLEFASNRFCELLNLENTGNLDDIFKTIYERIHPDHLQEQILSFDVAENTLEPYKCEMHLLIDSCEKWMRLEASPRKLDDGGTLWTGVMIDITGQKLADKAIQISEEKYHMLLDLATDAFFHLNKNGDFITVNSSAAEQSGFSTDELLKMNIEDLFFDKMLVNQWHNYDSAAKGEIISGERELVRKDGKTILIDLRSRRMPDGTFQSFFRDITEQRRTEEALKQKLGEMEIYYELAFTRERKMIALKSEINLLLKRLGEEPKY